MIIKCRIYHIETKNSRTRGELKVFFRVLKIFCLRDVYDSLFKNDKAKHKGVEIQFRKIN